MIKQFFIFLLICSLCLIILSNSEAQEEVQEMLGVNYLPDTKTNGWIPLDDMQVFHNDELYNYIDGAAELYFEYGFSYAIIQDYKNKDGGIATVELHRMNPILLPAYGICNFLFGVYADTLHNTEDYKYYETMNEIAFYTSEFFIKISTFDSAVYSDLHLLAEAIQDLLHKDDVMPNLYDIATFSDVVTPDRPNDKVMCIMGPIAARELMFNFDVNLLQISNEIPLVCMVKVLENGNMVKYSWLFRIIYPDDKKCDEVWNDLTTKKSDILKIISKDKKRIVLAIDKDKLDINESDDVSWVFLRKDNIIVGGDTLPTPNSYKNELNKLLEYEE